MFSLEAFHTFFSDGQKFEDDARAMVLAPSDAMAHAVFRQLADLVTVQGYVSSRREIRFRSGAVLTVRVCSTAGDHERLKGSEYSHLIIMPCNRADAIQMAKTCVRSANPSIKAGRATISYA